MKAVVAVLLVGLALASATSVLDRLKEQVDQVSGSSLSFSSSLSGSSAIPATHLESESLSGSLVGSGSGSSGCAQDPCSNPVSFANNGGGGGGGMGVDDAIRPVGDWLKDFQRRTTGSGNDLWQAARATVKPLVQKLRRNQQRAQERLVESNLAVLRHVEEATTQHIYTLLKSDKSKSEDEDRKEEHAAKIMEAKKKEKEAKENTNAQLGVNSEQAAALESVLKSSGVAPSQSVIDNIAKIISTESSSASKALSAAIKKASSSAL